MFKSRRKRWGQLLVIAFIAMQALAFISPQKNDLVELNSWLNGREKARFEKSDRNILKTHAPGTKALIVETKTFSSGNYGICIQTLNQSIAQNCSWVYYRSNSPNMKLYSVSKDPAARARQLQAWGQNSNALQTLEVRNPALANAAVTTVPVTAIQEPIAPQPSTLLPVDTDSFSRGALESFNRVNNYMAGFMSPRVETCTECSVNSLNFDRQCTDRNNYLQNGLMGLIQDPNLAAILQAPSRPIIRPACVQRSLDVFPNLRDGFKNCSIGAEESKAKTSVAKACTSREYVDVTSRSFNAVAECMADFVSGSSNNKEETTLEIFALMAHESGLHTNAVSATGAGGIGQLTYGAIEDVNSRLSVIRNHLKKSTNPICNQTLVNVLKDPMSSRSSHSCERIVLNNENPLKNMIYTFASQGTNRKNFENNIFKSSIFTGVVSDQLPALERERLLSSLTIWSHNTGPGGMKVPLRAQMAQYLRNGKEVKTAADVDQFLVDMRQTMVSNPHDENSRRKRSLETAEFFDAIQDRMKIIAREPRTCLVN